jgi:hypothetical protein
MPTLAFAEVCPARHSRHSRNPLHAGTYFVASLVRFRHGLCCSPPYRPDRVPCQRGLYIQVFDGAVIFPSLDMTTTVTGLLCWRTLTRWNGS